MTQTRTDVRATTIIQVMALAALVAAPAGVAAAQDRDPAAEPPPGPPPSVVRTAPVREELIQAHRRVTGSLQAVSSSAVAAREAAAVEEVMADEGLAVRAGDVLARLDGRRLRAQLAETEAGLESDRAIGTQREAELAFARQDLERLRHAHERQAASARELSEAQTVVDVRAAQLEAARRVVDQTQRRVELLRIRVGDLEVRAPFDAEVVARHVEPGEWIEAGEPVVTLVSTGVIEARLEVPERFAPAVIAGADRIYVEVAASGQTLPSIDIRPVSRVDERARTFPVIVTLPNEDGRSAPGMSVEAWLPTSDQARSLVAPKDAIIRDGRSAYVYRASAEQDGGVSAQPLPVKVLFEWGDSVAIDAIGLAAGDRVVVEGNERLMPGAPLILAARPDHDTEARAR